MTALDQAFIKAFSQQGALSVATPPRPAAVASKPSALPLGERQGETVAPSRQPSPLSFACEVASRPPSEAFGNVLAVLEKPPVQPKNLPWAEGGRRNAEQAIANEPAAIAGGQSVVESQPWAAASEPWKADTGPWTVDTGQWTADGGPSAVGTEPAAAVGQRGSAYNVQGSDSPDQSPSLVTFPSSNETPAPPDFKPAWQVDRFTWPRVCRRLIGRAADELDRLADAISTANACGQKVLAIAGCCRGEGATTLLLCAARRLAERGIKAVLVDADRSRPRLAKRLGVQPQFGWDETSADDGRTLDQAVVEAVTNNLALAPLREPSVKSEPAAGDWSRLAPCIETLRRHYEMVLVDFGPLEDIRQFGHAMARTPGGKIDAVLLVHNRRITPDEALTEVEQRLGAAGIAVAGVIENFVAE
jgi:Mrp family chromosome partitioning ATPase